MNKQSIKLLKQAAYYIKKAEFEKQGAIKGKSMSKAWEAGSRGLRALGEGAKKGWNRLWGGDKAVEAPKPEAPKQVTKPVKPRPTAAATERGPKRPETGESLVDDVLAEFQDTLPQDARFRQLSPDDQGFGLLGYGLFREAANADINNPNYVRPSYLYRDLRDYQRGLREAYANMPETSYFRSPEAPNYLRYVESLPREVINRRLENLQNRYENMALRRFFGQTGATEAERRAFDKKQNVIGREAEEYLDFMGRRGPQGEILYNIENPDPNGVNFFNMYDGLLRPEGR